jgi:hypothetical protein
MNRLVLIAIVTSFLLFAGCDIEPGQGRDAKAVSCGVLATESIDMPPIPTPSPTPSPTPTPGPTKCDNCNGTGRVGDGRVFVPCPVCGGDGVK